jgi:azurin
LYYSDLNPELLEPEGQKKFLGGKAWLVDKIGSVPAVQFTADSMYAVDMERGGNVEEAWIREVGYSIGEEREDPGGRVLLHGNAKTDTLVLDPMDPDSLLWVGAERLPFGLVSYLERVSRDVQKAARTYRKERRKELRQRRAAASRKITLRPQGNQMEFEQDEFSVFAGKSVELIFENTATSISMQHNVLVLDTPPEQDIFMEVGQAAVEAGAYENYVPDHEAVVAATPIAKPGERVSVTFNAPEEPGTYGFVCTFPGHWATGQGTMQVVPE